MFIRFVVGADGEESRWLDGIFTKAQSLKRRGRMLDYEAKRLEEIFDFFNDVLPVPPFEENKNKWTSDAVSWFRDSAKDIIPFMWDIVTILREHGVPIRILRTGNPGKILYEDKWQVVANIKYGSEIK